jgi:hypothetical protein
MGGGYYIVLEEGRGRREGRAVENTVGLLRIRWVREGEGGRQSC